MKDVIAVSSDPKSAIFRNIVRTELWVISIMLVVIIFGGAWLTLRMMRQTDADMRDDLLGRARRISEGLNIRNITPLTGSEADMDLPQYQRLKTQLMILKESEPDCRFMYLMGRRADGTIFFWVDSEPTDSEDYSPPGEVFDEADELEAITFITGKAVVDGPTPDRWGVWITAYVPIRESDHGPVIAVFGMDIAADVWSRIVLLSVAPEIVFISTIALVMLIISVLLVWRRRRGGAEARWLAYMEPVGVTLLGVLVTFYFSRLAYDRESRSLFQAFEQLAESETGHVAERIYRLRDHDLRSLARFMEASDEVTGVEFSHFASDLSGDPAASAWMWIPVVQNGGRSEFERILSSKLPESIGIWEQADLHERVYAGPREQYFPDLYVEPYPLFMNLVGYDHGSEPRRQKALIEAIESGLPTATIPVQFVLNGELCTIQLVYKSVGASTTGCVAFILRPDLILPARDPEKFIEFNLELLRFNLEPMLMDQYIGLKHQDSSFSISRSISAFNFIYRVNAYPGPAYNLQGPRRIAMWTFGGGLLLTGLMATALGLPVRRRERLEQLVAERTNALAESQRFLIDLVENSGVLIIAKDRKGVYLMINRQWEKVTHLSRDKVLGRTDLELFPKAIADQFMDNDREVMTSGRAIECEEVLDSPTGKRRYFLSVKFPMHDNRGEVTGVCGVITEITRQKEDEVTLREQMSELQRVQFERARLEMAIEQAAESVVITDTEGTIQYVNPAFSSVSGYSREEVMGQHTRILKSGVQNQDFYQQLWSTITSGKVWLGRLVNRKKNGELYTEDVTISPVHDEKGQITNYVSVKRDISREILVEKQLIQAQKMELIGRLAGGVAHDFNNILQTIFGVIDLARSEQNIEVIHREYLAELAKASESAASLTRQLLAFSRQQVLEQRHVDLNEQIESMGKMIRRVIGEDITLSISMTNQQAFALVDPGQIEQVILNLVVNARDAMPHGGTLSISTGVISILPEEVNQQADSRAGTFVQLAISDTGTGMTPETKQRIFEPFFTTKASGQGTGLGLATVFGIVKQHEGWINVYSELGHGSVFHIYLPVPETMVTQEKKNQEKPIPRGNGQNILVVEDEDAVRDLMARMLTHYGYRVKLASGVEEAYKIFSAAPHEFDLVCSDVVLRQGSGFDLVESIKKLKPNLKVLMVSGYTDERTRWPQIREKGWHYLQKPVSLRIMMETLHEMLRKK
ncbi:MAG TPA: PAS domain S-box protein [Kiritimatiellia bacterium]|nr:PAS domain S-box protein [Kiritimatiellia bacterium]